MVELQSSARSLFRRTALTALGLGLLIAPLASNEAAARYHRHYAPRYAYRPRPALAHRVYRPTGGGSGPLFAAYAVDGNSGRVLYAKDENATRHPASLTKVMTLYLLFEQLDKGHITLDTRISVSEHAAAQSPTKLGLRAGSTIRVEDAVKSIVTQSANDMAVAIGERLGGDEDTFARMMTRKAHALGMSRTTYVNASGLPDDRQITTARDLVTLGRAIHDRFPRYFHFFSTPSFRYAGKFMANHNHLMEQVEGMDGIKTGYTRSSGFNLLSSVNRNGHWLVSVVVGGRTRLGRDRIMADLIASQIDKCSTTRTAALVSENPALADVAEAVPVVAHEGDDAPAVERVAVASAEATAAVTEDAAPSGQSEETSAATDAPALIRATRPVPLKTVPVKVASLTSDVPAPRPRPAFVGGPRMTDKDMTTTGSIRPRLRIDGSTSRYAGDTTATPSSLRHGAHHERPDPADHGKPIKVASLGVGLPMARPASTKGGWMIQIGATESIAQANELIARAKSEGRGALTGTKPFTEKVEKGRTTLYRARFAGFESGGAEAACKTLKKAGFSCFAARN